MKFKIRFRYPFNKVLEKDEIVLEIPCEGIYFFELYDHLKQVWPELYILLSAGNLLDDSGYPNALAVVNGCVAGLDTRIEDQAELILFYQADGG